MKKGLNRIKVVLKEKWLTNQWLAEQLGKDHAAIFKWCINNAQPNLKNLFDIARYLNIDVKKQARMDALYEKVYVKS